MKPNRRLRGPEGGRHLQRHAVDAMHSNKIELRSRHAPTEQSDLPRPQRSPQVERPVVVQPRRAERIRHHLHLQTAIHHHRGQVIRRVRHRIKSHRLLEKHLAPDTLLHPLHGQTLARTRARRLVSKSDTDKVPLVPVSQQHPMAIVVGRQNPGRHDVVRPRRTPGHQRWRGKVHLAVGIVATEGVAVLVKSPMGPVRAQRQRPDRSPTIPAPRVEPGAVRPGRHHRGPLGQRVRTARQRHW
jgi:hypothetical protein